MRSWSSCSAMKLPMFDGTRAEKMILVCVSTNALAKSPVTDCRGVIRSRVGSKAGIWRGEGLEMPKETADL